MVLCSVIMLFTTRLYKRSFEGSFKNSFDGSIRCTLGVLLRAFGDPGLGV